VVSRIGLFAWGWGKELTSLLRTLKKHRIDMKVGCRKGNSKYLWVLIIGSREGNWLAMKGNDVRPKTDKNDKNPHKGFSENGERGTRNEAMVKHSIKRWIWLKPARS